LALALFAGSSPAFCLPPSSGADSGRELILSGQYEKARQYYSTQGASAPDAAGIADYLDLLIWTQKNLTATRRCGNTVLHAAQGVLDGREADALCLEADRLYRQIEEKFSIDYGKTISIYLYPEEMEAIVWKAYPYLSQYQLTDGKVHVFFGRAGQYGQIGHEMVHAMTQQMAAFSAGKTPDLLIEGLAEYLDESPWGVDLDAFVKRFGENGAYLPLSRLWNPVDFRRAPRLAAYVQAGSFVRFLVQEFGLEKFKRLYARPDLKAVYGKSLLELEEQWLLTVQKAGLDEGARRIVDYRMSLATHYASENGLLNMPWAGFAVTENENRVSIEQVFEASPASRLGLKPHDEILAIDGRAVRPGTAWVIGEAIFEKRPGDAVALAISRQGLLITKRLTLAAKPLATGLPQNAPEQPEGPGR
jgi:hypothetical protein